VSVKAQSLKSDSISGLIRFAITAGNAYFGAMPKFEFCIPHQWQSRARRPRVVSRILLWLSHPGLYWPWPLMGACAAGLAFYGLQLTKHT
jgi:hypothetical protein